MSDPVEINGKVFTFELLKMKQKCVVGGKIASILMSAQGGRDIDGLEAFELAKILFKHATIDGYEVITTDDGIDEAFGGEFSFMMRALLEAGKANFPDLFGKAEALAKNSDSAIHRALKESGLANQ